ncbi:MAG: glutamate N-acetyltransferase/amino-acid N-acetyltransferase [Verrucomicrobiales bacterium]|jgi:glutamate N-acetyltransferase/amino-acid N-acetyltransferase
MADKLKQIGGGVCAPKGFQSSAVKCGIKNPKSPKLDLALIYSEKPCSAAAVFTRNRIVAAPVKVSKAHLRSKLPKHAILANSGNANACAGPHSVDDARELAKLTAAELGIRQSQILVGSTGIIGQRMPMDRIKGGIPGVVSGLSSGDSDRAAEAIMTSDTKPKQIAIEVEIGGQKVRIGGIAKGAGMIRPDMATMLAFITTDVKIGQNELIAATREASDESFNRITIDGDMSTNDTVFVLANGEAGNRSLRPGGAESRKFRDALCFIMLELAKMIVRDGERVTKFVTVTVSGARTQTCARKAAEAVANSSLVKSSWNGNDPNWGRVIHALGYSGASIDETLVDIHFNGLSAAEHGMTSETPIEDLVTAVSKPEFSVCVDLHLGGASHVVYASDLSPEYVEFNRQEYSAARAKELADD